MSSNTDEPTATDHVHALADTGAISKAIADRLDDNGFETIADLLIADQEDLEDVPYVGAGRAADILAAVDAVTSGPEPLVDSREVVLEATLGEKLNLTMADRDGYANAWAVVDTEEPTVWEAPFGDTWQTRRIRISQSMSGDDTHRECDLVLAADEIRLEDPPVKRRSSQPDAPSWVVGSVGAVGRVAPSTFAQLQGRQEQHQDARPEGDDTWRKYQRGEA